MKARFIVVRRKAVVTAICLVLAFAALIAGVSGSGAYAVFFNQSIRKVPIYRVDTPEKKVALTFDAAWGADKTQDIIDIIAENGGKGTFFLVGFWVDKYGEKVKSIDEAGFEIGTHSATHPKMSQLSRQQQKNELESSKAKIEQITGKPVKIFRPPFGDYNNSLIETADELGLKTIQWGTDSLDWKGLKTEALVQRVMSRVGSGDIVLFHNNSDYIVQALPVIVRRLVMQGYELVTVSELVYSDNYTIDSNGVQHRQQT